MKKSMVILSFSALLVLSIFSAYAFWPFTGNAVANSENNTKIVETKDYVCIDPEGNAKLKSKTATASTVELYRKLPFGNRGAKLDSKTDTCKDSKTVLEYSCEKSSANVNIRSTDRACGAGKACVAGACVVDRTGDYIIKQDFGSLKLKTNSVSSLISEDYKKFFTGFKNGSTATYSDNGNALQVKMTVARYNSDITFDQMKNVILSKYPKRDGHDRGYDIEFVNQITYMPPTVDPRAAIVVSEVEDGPAGNRKLRALAFWVSGPNAVFLDLTMTDEVDDDDALLALLRAYVTRYPSTFIMPEGIQDDFKIHCQVKIRNSLGISLYTSDYGDISAQECEQRGENEVMNENVVRDACYNIFYNENAYYDPHDKDEPNLPPTTTGGSYVFYWGDKVFETHSFTCNMDDLCSQSQCSYSRFKSECVNGKRTVTISAEVQPYFCSRDQQIISLCKGASYTESCEDQTAICSDSDGGVDYYTTGILSTGNVIRKDYCWKDSDNPHDGKYTNFSREYSCTAPNKDDPNIEGIGGPDQTGYYEVNVNCPNGCQNGACKLGPGQIYLTSDAPSQITSIDGVEYTIELISASDSAATIRVTKDDGTYETKEVLENSSKTINGIIVAVTNADETNLKLVAMLKLAESG
ncbi:hypothetical protein KW805_02720 [Candidatus Pacearchaeota archaeon]|nr:hypothetical protein [Candidatus Pacearchaeota archaeon]